MSRTRLTDMIKTAALDAQAAVLMAHTKPISMPKLLDAAGKIRGHGQDLTIDNVKDIMDIVGLELRSKTPAALSNLHRNLMKIRVAYITSQLDAIASKLETVHPVVAYALDRLSDDLEKI